MIISHPRFTRPGSKPPGSAPILAVLAGIILLCGTVMAASPGVGMGMTASTPSPLTLTVLAQREQGPAGGNGEGASLVPAEESATGDILRYSIGWRNAGTQELSGAEVVDPIPPQTVFLGEIPMMRMARLLFSADGGRTWSEPPLQTEVRTASGVSKVEIPPASYTHVKWHFPQPIPPGEAGTFSFRVKVR